MGEKILVESRITDAAELIKGLDKAKNDPSIVAWYYYDDADQWRLLIAGRAYDSLLPKQEAVAYQKVAETMASLSICSLSLLDIKLLRTDAEPVRTFGSLIQTRPGAIVEAHFTNTTVKGIFIKDMVVLRSSQSPQARTQGRGRRQVKGNRS
jgi:hypothetical protein